MATKIITKNSSTTTAIPTAGDLVQGELAVNVTDKRLFTEDSGGAIVELGTNPSTIDINAGTIDGAVIGGTTAAAGSFTTGAFSGEITANGGIALGDGDLATFGASDDLKIYHESATNINYLEALSSNVAIDTAQFVVRNPAKNTNLFWSPTDGGGKYTAILGHETGGTKLQTTATGIDVTGTVTADGLTVDGIPTATGDARYEVVISENQTASAGRGGGIAFARQGDILGGIKNTLDATASNSQMSFQTRLSGTVATKMTLDASGNVGIGTSSPSAPLEVNVTGAGDVFKLTRDTGTNGELNIDFAGGITNFNSEQGGYTFTTSSVVNAMTLDASGNVGIGMSPTASGNYTILDIKGKATTSSAILRFYDGAGTSTGVIQSDTNYGVLLGAVGARPLSFFTNGSERMRIDSSGNVGIGGSPRVTASVIGLTIGNSTIGGSQLVLRENTGNDWRIFNNGYLAFIDDTTEAMRIDGGNVGIGDTTFAAGKLQVYDSSGNHVWLKGRASDGTSSVSFRNNADNTYNGRIQVADAGGMLFQVAGSTRATIDASGNLLVGTTDTFPGGGDANTGVSLTSTGAVVASRDGDFVARFNRKTSDGEIIGLNKDGTTVGSIGSTAGKLKVSSVNTGLIFADAFDEIYPLTNGVTTLGDAGASFKDLYLSGGVYLGGTGAANKLDDYEEGTWTPVVRDAAAGNAATAVSVVGIYTKVGRTVTFELTMTNVTTTGLTAGNGIYITGLPFAKYNDGNMFGSYPVQRNAFSSTDGMLTASIIGGQAYMRIFNELAAVGGTSNALVSQITSGAAEINICGTYQTD